MRKPDGSNIRIDAVSLENLSEPEITYNLEIDHDHDYFAGTKACTVLVHNTDPFDILFSRNPGNIQATDTFIHGPWANRTLGEAVAEARQLGKLPEGLQLNATWLNEADMVTANNRTLWVAQEANLTNVSVKGLGSNSVAKDVIRHLDESLGPFCAR